MIITKHCSLYSEDYESNIKTTWQELQYDKDLCDVTLACEDKQIRTHKIIIASSSPVLKNILKNSINPNPLIFLTGVKFEDLENLLNFIYQGELNIAEEDLDSFLAVAKDLQMKGLSEASEKTYKPKAIIKLKEYPNISEDVDLHQANLDDCDKDLKNIDKIPNHPIKEETNYLDEDPRIKLVQDADVHQSNSEDLKNIDKTPNSPIREETNDLHENPRPKLIHRTNEFKLKVINSAKLSSNHAAARKFGVSETSVRYWKKREEIITYQINGGEKPFILKPHHKEVEQELLQWLVGHQNVGKVTPTEMCKQALVIHNKIDEGILNRKEFTASRGWLNKFLSRNNLIGSDRISFYERNDYKEDEKPYLCTQCGKKFLSKGSLKIHLSCHTGEKIYTCQFCVKAFRIKQDMKIHERIHTGEKPYSCDSCGKSCTDLSNFRKHQKSHQDK